MRLEGIIVKYFYWCVNKLRWSSQSGLFPVKDRYEATISDKERVSERWVEHFENVLNRDRAAGKRYRGYMRNSL